MHTGRRYRFWQTLVWSRWLVVLPLLWSGFVTTLFVFAEAHWLGIPTLPMSLIGVAVAFYLGFKNNASYDRLWEARKIWGGIVNSSRAWALGARDLVSVVHGAQTPNEELSTVRRQLVMRHIAWLHALRHQLRKLQPWEHTSPAFQRLRAATGVAEYRESLSVELTKLLPAEEVQVVLAQINPALHLLANQSRALAELRTRGLLDGHAHVQLQRVLDDLLAEQGKSERIKNFPFPRQYATVNFFFAVLFAVLIPFGLLPQFAERGPELVWLTVPFSTVVSWVFLTTDKIGDWSENPFEGLANDVPITSMARGIARDLIQLIGDKDLPAAAESHGALVF